MHTEAEALPSPGDEVQQTFKRIQNFNEKNKRKFFFQGICSISAIPGPTSDHVGMTVETCHAVTWHRTCVKVDPHGEQRPCDGHERLAVVVGVKSDAADSLVDRVHQE